MRVQEHRPRARRPRDPADDRRMRAGGLEQARVGSDPAQQLHRQRRGLADRLRIVTRRAERGDPHGRGVRVAHPAHCAAHLAPQIRLGHGPTRYLLRRYPVRVGSGVELEYLDRTVRPCDDFYRFANGRWLATATIPPEERAWGAFAELRDRNQAVLREILETAAADRHHERGTPAQLVGDFFASGMDEAAIERAGIASIEADLARIDGARTPEDRAALLALLHAGRAFPGFVFTVLPDAKDSRTTLFQIQQGGLGLPDRDYYLKEDGRSNTIREQYRAHVARMLELLGHRDAQRDADTIFRLELRLAQASMPRVDQRDPDKVYNKHTLAELEARAPGFGWSTYLGALGVRETTLNARQPAFLTELAKMSGDESPEDWRVYLRWHLLHARAPYLPARFEDEDFAFFHRVLEGVPSQQPRWKRVLETVDQRIGEALGRLYVARAFPPEAKKKVLDLVEDLR